MKLTFTAILLAALAQAAPMRRSTTTLSTSDIAAFTDPAQFASAAYCSGGSITAWTCGSACNALTQPLSVVTGGDGGSAPRYFVATTSSTTVVAISGTNTSNALSIAVDLEFALEDVDDTFFPNNSGAQVHTGFNTAFEGMQSAILAAVEAAGSTDVLVTGHSLGGALTLMVATNLQQTLPSYNVTAKAFASPRIGNQEWADYVDDTLGDSAKHMVNYNDDVPHVPPRQWGFQQSSGEIWILADGSTYLSCTGQESSECSDSLETPLEEVALVESFVTDLDIAQHLGPYAGVVITSLTCTDY